MRLPTRPELLLLLTSIVAFLLLALCGRENEQLRAALAAKPQITDKFQSHVEKQRHVGAKKTETTTIIKPDGSKEIHKISTVASEDDVVAKDVQHDHEEKPIAAAAALKPPTRYVGLGLPPTQWHRPSIRAGLTLWGWLDLGGRIDTGRSLPEAMQVEAAYRF